MRKIIIFIFLLHVFMGNFLVFSQEENNSPKKELELEEELNEKEADTKTGNLGNIEKTVKGEDLKVIQNRKKESALINPLNFETKDWEDPLDVIDVRRTYHTKKIEKKAYVKSLYGLYDSFVLDANIVKKDKFGIYMFQYNRIKYDSEGKDEITIDNSQSSIDDLNLKGIITLNHYYKLILDMKYYSQTNGLQKNISYKNIKKNGFSLSIDNSFRLSEHQKFDFTLSGKYLNSSLTDTFDNNQDFYYSDFFSQLKWEYILGNKNSINIEGSFQYIDNQDDNIKNIYKAGSLKFWDIFPLLAYKGKTNYEVNLKLGIKSFFTSDNKSKWIPDISLESIYGIWNSKLYISGETRNPLMDSKVLRKKYFNFFQWEDPEHYYSIGWKSQLKISQLFNIFLDTGLYYYEIFFNPIQVDNIYTYEEKLMRLPFAQFNIQTKPLKKLSIIAGLKFLYPIEDANLISQIDSKISVEYSFYSFELKNILHYLSSKTDNELNIDSVLLWNVQLAYNIDKSMSFIILAENILNKEYKEVYSYNKSGIKIYGGFNLNF